jgi:hypothetical protein
MYLPIVIIISDVNYMYCISNILALMLKKCISCLFKPHLFFNIYVSLLRKNALIRTYNRTFANFIKYWVDRFVNYFATMP